VGLGINEHSETAFDEGVQTLEETAAKNPDVGNRDSGQAAKRRTKHVRLSSRKPHVRSCLGWLLPPEAA
jgi:hypothetical protein